jgi:hypothetical protein
MPFKYYQKNLLLISPFAYNYHELIIQSAERLGLATVWLNERPSNSLFFKVFSRYSNYLARAVSLFYYKRRLKDLISTGFSPDYFLVIKGESVHPSIIDYITLRFPACRTTAYFWDSTANLNGCNRLVRNVSRVFSFDPLDCLRYDWSYRPLFAGNASLNSCEAQADEYSYDWSFIGVSHSDRVFVLDCLARSSSNFFLYLYFPSLFHWLLCFLRYPLSLIRLRQYVFFESLSGESLSSIYQCSRSVVDINHPSQTGLTMRCVESLMSGKKLLTTNLSIRDEPLYSKSRVFILDRNSPCFPLDFLLEPFEEIPENLRFYYSADGWLSALL